MSQRPNIPTDPAPVTGVALRGRYAAIDRLWVLGTDRATYQREARDSVALADPARAMVVSILQAHPGLWPLPTPPDAAEQFERLNALPGIALSKQEYGRMVGAASRSAPHSWMRAKNRTQPHAAICRVQILLDAALAECADDTGRASLVEAWRRHAEAHHRHSARRNASNVG